ncbi:hypothetical protein AQUCO_05400087v1 [Aquilegia coerulea]|uniref:Membrane-associated kinase regulator 1 n=1 Tax=Aquilegia coerulea TaxID=218851 RepID=A0A2G5CHM3_AQUCA|nr:hypothetical protein AQUCO_05400087v1 [Aquilegia coerulea]
MGRRRRERERDYNKSQTLPPSPSHSFSSSSSSSDFEFTISLSSQKTSTSTCPADELFYKGQLLPLQLSPRLSMVRTLLLASPSSSSSSDTTSASRDSTGSSNSNDSNSSFASDIVLLNAETTDSARPSSVTEEDEFKRVQIKKSSKYFSLSRFSSVFRKDGKNREHQQEKVLKKGNSTKEVIRKYLKKVKPLYDKFSSSQKQKTEMGMKAKCLKDKEISFSLFSVSNTTTKTNNGVFSNSFSGNLKYPRRKRCVSSCPSSMRSSPSHSHSLVTAKSIGSSTTTKSSDFSSMEELQSAIQGAIAHCKNSMIQDTTSIWMAFLGKN